MSQPSAPNLVTKKATLSVFEFERIFGAVKEIGNDERTPTDIENFLQNYLGYQFVFSPRSSTGKIAVAFHANADTGPNTRNPAVFLEKLVKMPKEATKEQRKGTDEAPGLESQFLNKFLAEISQEISTDVEAQVEVKFQSGVNDKFGKGSFSIEGLPAEHETSRNTLARKISSNWDAEYLRFKRMVAFMPLEVEDLDKVPHNVIPDIARRLEFQASRKLWLNQTEEAATSSIPKTATRSINPTAIIYLPASVAGSVESEWRNGAKTQAPRRLTKDEKPTWHDYLASLSAITGYAIEFSYEQDLRRTILQENETKQGRIAELELDKKRLEADLENTPDAKQKSKKQGAIGRVDRTIKNLQDEIQSKSLPFAEVVKLEAPSVPVDKSEGFASLRITTIDSVSTARDLARFQAVADAFGWLVSSVITKEQEFAATQKNYGVRLLEWQARHPNLAQEIQDYQNKRAAFEAIPSDGLTKTQLAERQKEKTRIDELNPERDRPIQPKEKFVSLDDVRRIFNSALEDFKPKAPSSQAPKPRPDADNPARQGRARKEAERARQAAEELARDFMRYPMASAEIVERMRGQQDVWLTTLRKELNVDLRVSPDDLKAFYLLPAQAAILLPVLAELSSRATLRDLGLDDMLFAKALGQPASEAFSQAASAISKSAEYTALVKDVSAAQLDMIIGADRKHLKEIAKEFHFDEQNFKVTENREIVFSEKALQESASKTSVVQLQLIFNTLRTIVRSNQAITDENVRRAIEQSFAGIRESQKDLSLTPFETAGQGDHGVFASVMRDIDRNDVTHTPREIIAFSERGRPIFDLIKGGKNTIINKIRDVARLPSIAVGDYSLTLVSHQTGEKRNGGHYNDGTAKLDTAHDLIIRLANVIAERGYKRQANADAALQYVLGNITEDRLPSTEIVGADKADAPKKALAVIKEENRIRPRTDNQQRYVEMLDSSECPNVIAVGPPGTGKTLLTIDWAVRTVLDRGTHEQLILITPVRNDFGYLPGNLKEKTGPSYDRLYAHIEKLIGRSETDRLIDKEVIVIRPPDNLLGLSFRNAIVYCDEAEDLPVQGMRTLVTRPEGSSKLIITGDLGQFNGDSEKALKNAREIRVPNTVKITEDGIVEIFVRIPGGEKHWLPIGSYLDVGDFREDKAKGLVLKPLNGLAFAAINQTPSPYCAAMGFGINDVQRGDPTRIAQILMDDARVPRALSANSINPSDMQGTFDPELTIREQDAARARYMASRGGHVKLVS